MKAKKSDKGKETEVGRSLSIYVSLSLSFSLLFSLCLVFLPPLYMSVSISLGSRYISNICWSNFQKLMCELEESQTKPAIKRLDKHLKHTQLIEGGVVICVTERERESEREMGRGEKKRLSHET